MIAAVTLIATGSALDATGILGARETLASGADSDISGAGSEARREYGFLSSGAAARERETQRAWEARNAEGGVVQSAKVTTQSVTAAPDSTSAPGGLAGPSGDPGAQRPSPRVAGAESSDAGFGRTVIRGPVAEVARAGGNTPAASDYIEGGDARNRGSKLEPTSKRITRRGCADNRRGLAYYSRHASAWLELRGVHSKPTLWFPKFSCDFIRRAVQLVRSRAQKARRSYEAWHTAQWVLREQRTWRAAVNEVQRPFPSTAGWLLSCSDAESNHYRWVRYGGGSYYPGYEYTDAVGGFLQYRWSTFRGHFRNGLDSLRSRQFKVPAELRNPDDVRAWLSPLGQAIAGGWARWSGNDNSHWSASFGRGC